MSSKFTVVSSSQEIITIYDIKGKQADSVKDIGDENNGIEKNELNFLCILFKFGKIGAAYYNFIDKQLYVYEEMCDAAPQYLSTISLFREIQPRFVLTIGSKSEEFTKVLSEIITYGESCLNSTVTTDTVALPKNLFLVPLKEYTYETCRAIVSQINLFGLEDEPSETKREVYLHSLINFDNKLSLQAIGTLVKFLEKNWSFFGFNSKTDMCYIHINQISRKNHILMDNSTFQSLQIFSKRGHEAGFKRGSCSSEREGLSVYKLFSTNCKSEMGLMTLRNLLLNPINDKQILNKRLDFIEFVLDPSTIDFVESLRNNLQSIVGDINVILTRIENSQAKVRDWLVLYKAIYHMIFVKGISTPYIENCSILMELHEKITPNLLSIEETIKNCLDFDASKRDKRPVVRYGLDGDLDAKKLRKQDIIKSVMAAARFAADNLLPDFLDECSVVYIPEMGHLISIKEWASGCSPEELLHLGFQFVFRINERFHYKNPMCVELDKRLGDIITDIIDHENRILRRLSEFVMKHTRDIREPLKMMGLIDCLISMAITASSKAYIRPSLNEDDIIELEDCRHPLMEVIIDQFQSNSFYSGGKNSKVKIITGPNGSGKTVYLKQICLTVYLAHVGSFVPCARANINLLNAIHTKLLATESASIRLSSFMIDLKQMANVLRDNSSKALILMDEFGKGTIEAEGVCLLEGVLKHFLNLKVDCPHILISTHFHNIQKHLPKSHLINYLKMVHTNENSFLLFLYKIAPGISNSFSIDAALAIGLDRDIVVRASQIFNSLTMEEPFKPSEEVRKRNNFNPHKLEEISIPEPDEIEQI